MRRHTGSDAEPVQSFFDSTAPPPPSRPRQGLAARGKLQHNHFRSMVNTGEPRGAPRENRVTFRDLRQLDLPATKSSEPYLAVRRGAILLRVGQIRAIILRTRVYLIANDGLDGEIQWLQSKSKEPNQSSLPFELHMVDVILQLILEERRSEAREMGARVANICKRFKFGSSLEHLEELRDRLTETTIEVTRIHAALTDVVDDEHELTFMQLSRICEEPDAFLDALLGGNPSHGLIEATEALVEDHLQGASEILSDLQLTQSRLENNERTATLALDKLRNRLLGKCMVLLGAAWPKPAGSRLAGHTAPIGSLRDGDEPADGVGGLWEHGTPCAVGRGIRQAVYASREPAALASDACNFADRRVLWHEPAEPTRGRRGMVSRSGGNHRVHNLRPLCHHHGHVGKRRDLSDVDRTWVGGAQ
jgi:hypothetical protein